MKKKDVESSAKSGSKRRPKELTQHERTAMRAYQLYLAPGAMEGDALREWFEAEREIGGQHDSGESP